MSYLHKVHHIELLSTKGWCSGESLSMLVARGNWTRNLAAVTCRACLKKLQEQQR